MLRRRWVIERTFGWLMRYRRLARDCERRTDHADAMIYWATVIIMTRRLARYQTGQAPEPRWGGDRQPRHPTYAEQPRAGKARAAWGACRVRWIPAADSSASQVRP